MSLHCQPQPPDESLLSVSQSNSPKVLEATKKKWVTVLLARKPRQQTSEHTFKADMKQFVILFNQSKPIMRITLKMIIYYNSYDKLDILLNNI